jgi:hypothetical protein
MLDAMSIELDAFVDEPLAFDELLRPTGHVRVVEGLQPVQTATTVWARNGKVWTTDGPLAGAKAQLGGVFLINAKDLAPAIRRTSKISSALKQPWRRTRRR